MEVQCIIEVDTKLKQWFVNYKKYNIDNCWEVHDNLSHHRFFPSHPIKSV